MSGGNLFWRQRLLARGTDKRGKPLDVLAAGRFLVGADEVRIHLVFVNWVLSLVGQNVLKA